MPLRKIYGIISQNRMKILIRSSWIWWQGQKVMLYAEFQLHSSLATPCRFPISSELIVRMRTAFRFNFSCWSKFSWFGFQSWPNLPNFEAICVENTQLCSKNLFLHINEETLALSHLISSELHTSFPSVSWDFSCFLWWQNLSTLKMNG